MAAEANSTKPADTINESAGMLKKNPATMARINTMAPAIKKLLKKLKSFLVVSATAERPTNVRPVMANAFIINAPPLGRVR